MLFYNRKRSKFEFYPKAFEADRRSHGSNAAVIPIRRRFIKLALTNLLILQTLFLLLFAYIYGSLFQLNSRVSSLNIVFVDYDGGVVGTAVRNAYNALAGPGFPTLIEQTPQEYADSQALRDAVCQADYWAALFVSADASGNFENALAGGASASSYNRSDVLTYIWNEARYSTISDSEIAANLGELSAAAMAMVLPLYTSTNPNANINIKDQGTIEVLSQPWTLEQIDIKPTNQGSRLIYNTLLIVLVLIQDFFFLGIMNGLYGQLNMYVRLWPHRIVFFRIVFSLFYTFIGALCTTAMIYAFRAGWDLKGWQFIASWGVVWLFAHQNFLALDVFTVWLPPQYVPMALITWIVFNVTSVLLPFELSNGFYRWAYMMPAHEVFATLQDIWSAGCYPELRYALPVLFVMEVTSFVLSTLGVYRRAHYAILGEEQKEKEFQERIDTAMAMERKRESKIRADHPSPDGTEMEKEDLEARADLEAAEREVLAKEESDGFQEPNPRSNCDPISFPIFEPGERSGTALTKARTAI